MMLIEEVRESLRALNTNIFPVRSVAREVRVWQTTTEDDYLGPGCLVQDALEIPSKEETTEAVEGREE